MRQFQGARKYATSLSHLANIKQGSNETLKAYIKHFNEELATIHNPQENRILMATISGVRPKTLFWDKLQKDECKMLQEFYRRADKIMCLETVREAVHVGRSTPVEAPHEIALTGKFMSTEKSGDSKKRKSRDR